MACTDYSRIFISGNAYSALPEGKRLAVLAHEVLHIALRHAFRIGYRDKNRFEKAADAEVTFVLTESFPDPYGVKVKTEWRKLTAEQIYELLPPARTKLKQSLNTVFRMMTYRTEASQKTNRRSRMIPENRTIVTKNGTTRTISRRTGTASQRTSR